MKTGIQEPASLYSPANETGPRVALYARVSKHDTDCIKKKVCPYDHPGAASSICDAEYMLPPDARCPDFTMVQNPEVQLLKLRTYAKERGFQVPPENVYVYRASGADPNRPALERMMNDARAHRFHLILAVRLDRLARSVINFCTMLTDLAAAHVDLICIDQPEISTGTSTGRFMRNMLASVAELERDLIRERTLDGLEGALQGGKQLGRRSKEVDLARVRELRKTFSFPEIAETLNVSESTIKRRLRTEDIHVKKEGVDLTRKKDGKEGASETPVFDPEVSRVTDDDVRSGGT